MSEKFKKYCNEQQLLEQHSYSIDSKDPSVAWERKMFNNQIELIKKDVRLTPTEKSKKIAETIKAFHVKLAKVAEYMANHKEFIAKTARKIK